VVCISFPSASLSEADVLHGVNVVVSSNMFVSQRCGCIKAYTLEGFDCPNKIIILVLHTPPFIVFTSDYLYLELAGGFAKGGK
jgi:hypothetical protein